MGKVFVFFFASYLILSCKSTTQNDQSLNCDITSTVLQKALNTDVIDSLFLPDYKDSVLKVVSPTSTKSCTLLWQNKKVVYLDSDKNKMPIDPGTFEKRTINGKTQAIGVRIPSFVLKYDLVLINSQQVKLNLLFENNGISLDFDLLKKGDSWEISNYRSDKM